MATGEQEPLLEGQEAGNSVNATKEDVESGGHSPDAQVRAASPAGWERWGGDGRTPHPPTSHGPSVPTAL